jgi:hypothetical protein
MASGSTLWEDDVLEGWIQLLWIGNFPRVTAQGATGR